MNNYMATLSITLPDNVADSSNKVAKRLGISRTEFIRRAIIHELDNYRAQLEQNNIIQSFNAMKKSGRYLKESEELTGT